jgi:putative component of membrane protein insertase Oxa1/YidC/SpoIIIJ protein YidD
MPKQAKGISGKVATACIQFYQQTISPTNGPRSNFRPTSSRYMELAVKRYGFTKGILMGLDRLMRENDDAWVYRDIKIDQMSYKYDPAVIDKAKM